MGSLINILQLNSLISQPHQRPVLVSDRRFGIIHGNQMCLKISDNLISKNTSPWLYVENSFKAFLGKTFFDSINCFHAYVQHMRNRLIDRSLLLKHSLLTGKQNKCIQDGLGCVLSFAADSVAFFLAYHAVAFAFRRQNLFQHA